jgi:leucyl aminopeptidase
MKTTLRFSDDSKQLKHRSILCHKDSISSLSDLSDKAKEIAQADFDAELPVSSIFEDKAWILLSALPKEEDSSLRLEAIRKKGAALAAAAKSRKITSIEASLSSNEAGGLEALIEGIFLANYSFKRYQKKAIEADYKGISEITIPKGELSDQTLKQLDAVVSATVFARDLVNEPLSYLTASQLSEEIRKGAAESGFSVEVFDKQKIEALEMGGLLAVNRGSLDPPTFNIMEWKPVNATNRKPIVLVGKGVVYDTGGLSLKPTPNSMDLMKSDMGGSAAVIGAMYAVAKAELPIHVIALVPATDNRPGQNAYAPGDVVKMYDGTHVEVLNTDAEGRMILADALSYAKQYDPELVLDFATLTGAAARAIGPLGVVFMGTADDSVKKELTDAGNQVFERLAEFPFWDDYAELLKSDIADLKNIGGPFGGAITAGKFLQYFTDYPWLHFDIAGPAFLSKPDAYKTKGGSGVGVRLLFNFLSKRAGNEKA